MEQPSKPAAEGKPPKGPSSPPTTRQQLPFVNEQQKHRHLVTVTVYSRRLRQHEQQQCSLKIGDTDKNMVSCYRPMLGTVWNM